MHGHYSAIADWVAVIERTDMDANLHTTAMTIAGGGRLCDFSAAKSEQEQTNGAKIALRTRSESTPQLVQ